MFKIVAREDLAPGLEQFVIAAPAVARKARAGQFVVIRVDEYGERVPLTIADWDETQGTVTIVSQEVGVTTRKLGRLGAGDSVLDFIGPLGLPSEAEHFGDVVVVGGGVGIAVAYPVARAMKANGNHVISIIGARCQNLIFWEDRVRAVSDEVIVTTDDGSYGRKALVTQPLKELLEIGRAIDRVIAIGPSIMMKFVAKTTEPFGVKTIVSINSIMVDGTGMCGACRISVGGQTKFACVDGPDFDGHLVDWELLMARQRIYHDEEKRALELFQEKCQSCREEERRVAAHRPDKIATAVRV
ncbi:MAG: sulfide/dihydroorotate dehydrogenase-like FAD/NAD-binding protein [Chloroflexota bacterium]